MTIIVLVPFILLIMQVEGNSQLEQQASVTGTVEMPKPYKYFMENIFFSILIV